MMHLQSLHKNFILTGSVDNYCLVCDNYLRSEDEAFMHTEKPIHKKNMEAAIHLEKYKEDWIIKVKKGYYCTFCNTLLSTTTKVGLHVSNIKHQETKGVQMLSRVGDNIIAFDEVAIRLEAWHGIMDNTCVVCNTEFDEMDFHRSDRCHVLKLIQSKCEFGEKYVYRKVDEESFFCLICGNVYSITDKSTHHDNIKHTTNYIKGKELKNISQSQAKDKTLTKTASPKLNTENVKKDEVLIDVKSADSQTAKSSDAASAKKKEVSPAITTHAPTVTASETTKPVDGKKTEVVDTKKIKAAAKTTQDSTKESANTMPKVENVIANASKVINTNSDSKLQDYLSANNYIVQDGDTFRCILCDIKYKIKEYVDMHLSNDLHHQMMLKKHMQALCKKANKSTAQTNEKLSADNIVQIREPDNSENNGTAKTEEKVTVPHQPVNLKATPTADIQSKIGQQNLDCNKSDEKKESKSKNLDKVICLENDTTINITSKDANSKQCKEDVQCDTASHIDKVHTEEINDNTKDEQKEMKVKTETFARENYMKVMKNQVYCKLCNVGMLINMQDLIAHVNSSSHKDKVAIARDKKATVLLKKVPATEFMQTFFCVESNLGADVILNGAYVLRHHSFHCVILDEESSTCFLCNVDFAKDSGDQLTQHLNTIEHKQSMAECSIVTSFPEEFIREISPSVYHCGYCNKIADNWPEMKSHLGSVSHAYAKRHARWNLERCQSVIRNVRPMQVSSMHAVNFA